MAYAENPCNAKLLISPLTFTGEGAGERALCYSPRILKLAMCSSPLIRAE